VLRQVTQHRGDLLVEISAQPLGNMGGDIAPPSAQKCHRELPAPPRQSGGERGDL